jgi:ferredoxin-type protein NapH
MKCSERVRGPRLDTVRHLIQVAVCLLFLTPAVLAAVLGRPEGGGAFFGTLASSTLLGQVVLVDPWVALQTVAATRALPAFSLLLGAGGVLTVYALIGGRVFCGWVCPVNTLTELASWLRGRLRIGRGGLRIGRVGPRIAEGRPQAGRGKSRIGEGRPLEKREGRPPVGGGGSPAVAALRGRPHAKVVSLVGFLLLSALVGLPVFELLSPVNAVFRLLILGASAGFWLMVAILLAEFCFGGRVWCGSLCPLGGLYQLVGRVGIFRLARVEGKGECSRCLACKDVCLADPTILDPLILGRATRVSSGDCLLCGRCARVCPQRILRLKAGVPLR